MTVTINTLGPGIASQTTTVVNPTGAAPSTGGPTFGGGANAPAPAQVVQTSGVSVADGTAKANPNTTRDTRALSGGQPHYVNAASYVHTLAGKAETAIEVASLTVLDNFSDAGMNCGLYAQGNKFGLGPTWAACLEVCNTTPNDAAGLTGAEVDVWCTGADTGQRIGAEVVVGDANFIRAGVKHQAAASVGVRVGACQMTPWATWSSGYSATHFTYSGLHLNSKATRAIHLEGEYIVGLDLSTAKTQSAIRLAPGQRMTFEATDQISWSWLDGRLRIQNGAVNVLEIDTTTGDIYKRGVKVL